MKRVMWFAVGIAMVAVGRSMLPDLRHYRKIRTTEFDLEAARQNIHRVRPGMQILEISTKAGQGMSSVMEPLVSARDRWKSGPMESRTAVRLIE